MAHVQVIGRRDNQHHASHGLRISAPDVAKSVTLRVTIASSCSTAVAAIKPSAVVTETPFFFAALAMRPSDQRLPWSQAVDETRTSPAIPLQTIPPMQRGAYQGGEILDAESEATGLRAGQAEA
jgi:hypothetical protein